MSGGADSALITEVIDAYQAEDLTGVAAAGLDGEVAELEVAATRLLAEQLRRLGEWDRQGLWALDGSKSAAAALARRCDLAPGTARDRLRLAARLREAPGVAAAFAAGALSLAKVRLLTSLMGRTDTLTAAFGLAETDLVDVALRLSVRDLGYVVNHFAAHADPDGHEAGWDKHYRANRFDVSESFEGCGHLDGFLDPEATQIARHALAVIEDRLYREQHHQDKTRAGRPAGEADNPTEEGPRLTPAQRRAAAFVALCQSVLDDDPARDHHLTGVARPVIAVHLAGDLNDLLAALHPHAATAGTDASDRARQPSIFADATTDDSTGTNGNGINLQPSTVDGEPSPSSTDDQPQNDDDDDRDQPSTVDADQASPLVAALAANNVPLPRSVTQRLLCDATFVRILTHSPSAPLDVGRAARYPTTAMLRALLARDGGCAFPHCQTPARYCQAHHLHYWEHGGPTAVDNLVLVCRHHHQLLHHHTHRWRCHIDTATGLPHFTDPHHTQHPAQPTPLHHAHTARDIARNHQPAKHRAA